MKHRKYLLTLIHNVRLSIIIEQSAVTSSNNNKRIVKKHICTYCLTTQNTYRVLVQVVKQVIAFSPSYRVAIAATSYVQLMRGTHTRYIRRRLPAANVTHFMDYFTRKRSNKTFLLLAIMFTIFDGRYIIL